MRLSTKYDEIAWVMRIILGGALNIVWLNALSAFIEAHVIFVPSPKEYLIGNLLTPSALPQFVALVVGVLLSPFIISLILTKRQPDLRIVPSSYVSLIGLVWILVFWVFPLEPTRFFFVFLFAGVLYASGYLEDHAVTAILGIATDRSCIYFEHLRVFAEVNDVKARLSVPEIRDAISLSHKIDGDTERGYTFRTRRGYSFINRILLTKDRQFPEQVTNVKIVYFEKARYNLRVSPAFLEACRMISAYLKTVFWNHDPAIGFEVIIPITNNVSDPLVDSVVDEMYGYYVKSKRFSTGDLAKIVGLAGIFVMTVVLFLFDQPFFGGLSAMLDALFALAELPDILRRQI